MSRKKKIFLADDSLTIQKVIRLALSSDGYQIEAVSDGNDALKSLGQIASEADAPQFVLIDVALPGKTAFEIRAWSASQPALRSTKFILLCSAFETVDEVQFRALGFAGKLTKPFDPAHLRQMLAQTGPLASPADSNAIKDSDAESLPPLPSLASIGAGSPPPMSPPFSFGSESLDSGPEADIRALTRETLSGSGNEMQLPPLPSDLYSAPKPPPMTSIELDAPPLPPGPSGPLSPTDDDQWLITPPPFQGGAKPQTSPPAAFAPPPFPGNEPSSFSSSFQEEPSLPSLAPSPAGTPDIDEVGEKTLNNILRYEPTLPPPAYPREDGDQSLSLGQSESASELNALPALSQDQVQSLVEKQVQAIVEKVARRVLPDVAERVIKEEINKLLSEGPG